jgi:anti-sigma regulatory factor (Ser/Thr protein kinase)
VGALSQDPHQRVGIRADEDIGAARRAVARMAARLPDSRAGEAELAATELASNLLRHTAAGGYLLCRGAGGGIELLAVDSGPGIPSERMPTTRPQAAAPPRGGGLGVGLPAVRRLSAVFDCYSGPTGTVILARLHGAAPCRNASFGWGGVNVPLGGAGESGDGWAVAADGHLMALIVDGLGHGPEAAVAAQAAISAFGPRPEDGLERLLQRAHEAMRGTRGGVLAICAIDPAAGELTYAGVGNITGRLLRGHESQGLVSHDGTIGTQLALPRARSGAYRWNRDATVILASDGIGRHWDISAYPGLLSHDPAVVAAVLHRDHARGTDDATVVVVRDARSLG